MWQVYIYRCRGFKAPRVLSRPGPIYTDVNPPRPSHSRIEPDPLISWIQTTPLKHLIAIKLHNCNLVLGGRFDTRLSVACADI